MLEMCMCLCCERCILVIRSSVFLLLRVRGGVRGVKAMLLRMKVSSPPPVLWVRSILRVVKFLMLGVLW